MAHQHISSNKIRFSPLRKPLFFTAAAATLLPVVSPPVALLMGIALAQTTGNPYAQLTRRTTQWLLQLSVIGLGFGMNAHQAVQAGKEGLLLTIASIFATLLLGHLLGKILGIDKNTSHLVSSGTAICGGSAIAAIAPVIRANDKQLSVSLGIIFLLNSVALFLFPVLGHLFHLSQTQFGLWTAIAIHDTSSVVGAAGKYGPEALQVATMVKLSRALWIIPVSLLTGLLFRNGHSNIKIPWFIGLFVIALLLNTFFPLGHASYILTSAAKTGLSLTLFLIGSNLSREVLSGIGWKPLLQGILLWVFISTATLTAIIFLR
ncbi:YeiH family protein [Chitinophaga sp. sic0106]|uniref:YeiH family protein n=1 Tax=Chitinophaga sp. sic0106 TaxID=2854785 RepID=UPI001C47A4F9|nr:putative sulfate exporter family transporter [Chitinophaga sp. sic0106]MBV7531145.1 putative sulfate exporter family transporter [Chitinophaga sp. sic0106]